MSMGLLSIVALLVLVIVGVGLVRLLATFGRSLAGGGEFPSDTAGHVKLNCPHCHQETWADRQTCEHCHQEL